MQVGIYFPETRRMLLFHAPLIWNTFLASFHTASRAPCSCHSVSSWDRSSNFGAFGLRWWVSSGQIYLSEGFWSRIWVWRAVAFVNFTRWIGFCMSELFQRIDFGGFMSWNTQPNCRAFDDRRPVGPRFNSWSRFLIRSPWSIVTFSMVDNRFPYIFMPIILLQHSYCTLVIILFGPFTRLFINLTVWIRALFLKPATTLGHVEQAFWRVPLFTEWVVASSFDVILARPSIHSTAGTSSPGTSGSRCFSLILLHERIRRRIRLCHFSTLIDIVAETAIVSSRTLPVELPLPTISKNSLYTLFCSLILDLGVSLIISISSAKILISYLLVNTSFHHGFQSVIIRS